MLNKIYKRYYRYRGHLEKHECYSIDLDLRYIYIDCFHFLICTVQLSQMGTLLFPLSTFFYHHFTLHDDIN